MEPMTQISEIVKNKFPSHFKKFLKNCIKRYPQTFFASDYLFAAIYFIVLECGFCSKKMFEKFPNFCTESFDIRKLRSVKCYEKEDVTLLHNSGNLFMIYKIPLQLGPFRTDCEIQAIPSPRNRNHLIINLLMKEPYKVRSICIKMTRFLLRSRNNYKFSFVYKNMKELEILVKDEMCNPIKQTIMLEECEGSCATLLRLPEPVQAIILKCLHNSPQDIQNLSASCGYFNGFTEYDSKLWEKFCVMEFDKKRLKRRLKELIQISADKATIFKMAYLDLKKKDNERLQKILSGYRYW